jgi:hypothetical protein
MTTLSSGPGTAEVNQFWGVVHDTSAPPPVQTCAGVTDIEAEPSGLPVATQPVELTIDVILNEELPELLPVKATSTQ